MSYIIDRRLNDPKKSTVNRQRFLKRYRKHIKKAVSEAINNRSIKDLDRGEQIGIPAQDIDEPVFNHAPGGERDVIHPGNKEFVTGDTFPRPPGGAGSGSGEGKASNKGEGMDEFVFQITQEEFLDFMFDDLALPNLVKKQLAGTDSFKWVRAGISSVGVPAKINIVRSLRSANARRIAIGGSKRKRLRKLEQQLVALQEDDDEAAIAELEQEMFELKRKLKRIPFIDDFDIKYNLHIKEPMPSSKAVMFCLMDVSGSMSQATKDMAKRFFILLYLFLQRNYDHIDVVFIRHHTSAKEVDEEEFFYSRETGGTIVSSALKLMKKIMDDRYPVTDWNIYAAQASDGDNWNDDSPVCRKMLEQEILPLMQYFAYTEITPREHQALWREYEKLQGEYDDCFALRQIVETGDIYPVFRDLFQKRMEAAAV